ncbi:MAG TPA: hypothetical protein VK745_32535 [Polyangiaceae bacterium]|nr:hypothetical protein [Polyangiaceae bacterium]
MASFLVRFTDSLVKRSEEVTRALDDAPKSQDPSMALGSWDMEVG